MKLVRGTRQELLNQVQSAIDSLEQGSSIALAYNSDTSLLNYSGRKVIQIMDDCSGLLGSKFSFDVKTAEYDGSPIDLAVLGIGYKGQIGFNEVGTLFASQTHEQKLTDSTREEFSCFGQLGETGITMGISTIMTAKEIIVLAMGTERENGVFGMLYGRNDGTVPAAFLQLHNNVTVYADDAAASKC